MTIERMLAGIVKGGSATYVEDVFSTTLYTGTGATNTITNSIDLSTNGGLVWIKSRTPSDFSHFLATAPNTWLGTNVNSAQGAYPGIDSFNTNGFTLNYNQNWVNGSNNDYASWTFRKQKKFFDVVQFTGDGALDRQISHNLGSTPGMVIVKSLSAAGSWAIWHRSFASTKYSIYFSTGAAVNDGGDFCSASGSGTMNSSTFCVSAAQNSSGVTYIAYLFAHNAGGFGVSGTDSVVYCDSYTGNGSSTGPTITLGWEPQYVMIKKSSSTGDWNIFDNKRGMTTGSDPYLFANTSDTESTTNGDLIQTSSTGFQIKSTNAEVNSNGATYIYIAIRKGPMKV